MATEAKKLDIVGSGVNLYVRILSDRVMVRVGGGWVDLDQYLREYIGKREVSNRRRSGSVDPMHHQQQQQSPRSPQGQHNSPPTRKQSPPARNGSPGEGPGLYIRPQSSVAYYRETSLSPGIEGYEFLDVEEKGQFGRRVSTPLQHRTQVPPGTQTAGQATAEGRCVSSLGIGGYSPPPGQGGRNSSFEIRRSVSPCFSDFEGGMAAAGGGAGGRHGSVARRVFVRRK